MMQRSNDNDYLLVMTISEMKMVGQIKKEEVTIDSFVRMTMFVAKPKTRDFLWNHCVPSFDQNL